MTETLEQIQQENRKFILEAIHGCSYEEALKKEYAKKGNNTISVPLREYEGEELTLSRVLLAFSGKIFKNKISLQFPDFLHVNGFNWNLTKETLEEQTEETQRKINKLFNN